MQQPSNTLAPAVKVTEGHATFSDPVDEDSMLDDVSETIEVGSYKNLNNDDTIFHTKTNPFDKSMKLPSVTPNIPAIESTLTNTQMSFAKNAPTPRRLILMPHLVNRVDTGRSRHVSGNQSTINDHLL